MLLNIMDTLYEIRFANKNSQFHLGCSAEEKVTADATMAFWE